MIKCGEVCRNWTVELNVDAALEQCVATSLLHWFASVQLYSDCGETSKALALYHRLIVGGMNKKNKMNG